MRGLIRRIAGLFTRNQRDHDFDEEMESHLRMHIEDNIRAGLTPTEARRAAMLKLGPMAHVKEAYREQGSVPIIESTAQDARLALRHLAKNPGFAITAVGVLALGIGISTAIFAFVDASLLKPLPYRDPHTLVGVYESAAGFPQSPLSYLDYLDWKSMNTTLSTLEVYQRGGFQMMTDQGASRASGARVSEGFFTALGTAPALGRFFRAGEYQAVVINHSTWQQQYGASQDVIGRSITLNGTAGTIIGVLPKGFHFTPVEPANYWTLIEPGKGCVARRICHSLSGIGRLKPGVSQQAALTELKSIATQLEKLYPASNKGQSANVIDLSEVLVGNIRPILFTLLSGAGLLLLIATVNVTGLLVVRAESRRKEIALRSALGASRLRMFRQFLTEGTVLATLGCALGLLTALVAIQLLTKLMPTAVAERMPFLNAVGLNSQILTFAAIITILATIMFAIIPASSFKWKRLGSKLVAMELATAMVLLAGAGLLGKSLFLLLRESTGMRPEQVVVLETSTPRDYDDKKTLAVQAAIADRISALPGVQSVDFTSSLPL